MKRSYYAVIPADVRYDKTLPMGARMLYGELTALANEKGYCWATNSYFAELYGVTTVTVSNWVTKLEEKHYIERKIIYNENSKSIKERRIYIVPIKENFNTPLKNLGEGIKENFNRGIKENFKENTTVYNNTVNITNEKLFADNNACNQKQPMVRKPFRSLKQEEAFDQFWRLYPKKRSKGQAEKTWVKINPDDELYKQILSGLENAKKSIDWQKDGGQYIPYPSTWLNAKGWEDEYEKARQKHYVN